ncbi:hypothetical protein OG749_45990 (plasmid) [Streptomyces nojiriensis]
MPENASPAPKRTQLQRILRDAGQAALQGTALKFGAGTVTLLILWPEAM